MRYLWIIYLFASLLSVCSCGSGSKMESQWQEIDRLCDSLPKRAMAMLDSINQDGLSEKDLNRYRLLWIKSRDKAYVEHRSDTLILDVVDYYEKHRSEGLYPEALYYGGRVYSDLGDLPTALEFFQKSLDEIPEDDAHLRFRGIVLDQTGRLMYTLRLDSAAIGYLEKSLEIETDINDYYAAAFTHGLLAGSLLRKKNIKGARLHLDEAVRISPKLEKKDRETIQCELAEMLYEEGKTDSALMVIRPLPFKVDSLTSSYCLSIAADIYKDSGILDTAYLYARTLTRIGIPQFKRIGYRVIFSDEMKKYVNKDTILKLIPEYKQSIEAYLDTHEAEQALIQNARYNYSSQILMRKEAEMTAIKYKTLFFSILCSAVFILLTASTLILWYRYRKAKSGSSLMEAMTFTEKLKEETYSSIDVFTGSDKISNPDSQDTIDIKTQIREQIIALKGKTTSILVDSHLIDTEVYAKLKNKIDTNKCIADSDNLIPQLESILERVSPNFNFRLKILTDGSLSPKERTVALLMKCGFTNGQIATLLARSSSTITSQRSAIAKKSGFGIDVIDKIIVIL